MTQKWYLFLYLFLCRWRKITSFKKLSIGKSLEGHRNRVENVAWPKFPTSFVVHRSWFPDASSDIHFFWNPFESPFESHEPCHVPTVLCICCSPNQGHLKVCRCAICQTSEALCSLRRATVMRTCSWPCFWSTTPSSWLVNNNNNNKMMMMMTTTIPILSSWNWPPLELFQGRGGGQQPCTHVKPRGFLWFIHMEKEHKRKPYPCNPKKSRQWFCWQHIAGTFQIAALYGRRFRQQKTWQEPCRSLSVRGHGRTCQANLSQQSIRSDKFASWKMLHLDKLDKVALDFADLAAKLCPSLHRTVSRCIKYWKCYEKWV